MESKREMEEGLVRGRKEEGNGDTHGEIAALISSGFPVPPRPKGLYPCTLSLCLW